MLQAGIQSIWLALYHYYMEQSGELEKGRARRITVWVITFGVLLVAHLPIPGWSGILRQLAGWIVIVGVLFLYDLFYDAKSLRQQWWKILLPGVLIMGCIHAADTMALVLCTGAVSFFLLLLLGYERGHLRVWNGLMNLAVFVLLGILCVTAKPSGNETGELPRLEEGRRQEKSGEAAEARFLAGILGIELLLFFSLEGTLFSWQRGFEAQTDKFQREILGHQYEEIREIYLNMRGWRHDYHNHLQVMKVQLAVGQVEETRQYLDELEQNLESVDTYIKSGNLMVDAILNSKLTLAVQREIRVNCKAVLPEKLSVEDVDLCVLLGNLLDNAMEACEKISREQRFLRVYMAVNRAQLYISIQNSSREDLDFDERNYISKKRGSHGFGMKRVKALIDKYEGYLTLANEPGIFAAELTLPLLERESEGQTAES